MQRSFVLAMMWLSVVGCAKMQRDWEAQQQAQAQQQAAAQPTNVETACKSGVNAYCTRCNIAQADCGQTYINCVNGRSPADPSNLTQGQVDQCAADIGAGDCTVMPSVWPASCSAPTPPPDQTAQAGAPDPAATPACPEGAQWDGAQCACPAGTGWNGEACVAVGAAAPAPAPARRLPDCRALVVQHGFGPGAARECAGAEPLCAEAVLNANFGPGALANCRGGVKGRCAVAVIAHNFGPGAIANCRGVDSACAVAVLDQGNGPGAIANCKR